MSEGRRTNLRDILRLSLLATSFAILASGQNYAANPPSATPAVAPSCLSGTPGTLSVTGNGLAEAVADTGTVSVSISNLNGTAEGARRVAAGTATAVISAITQIQGIQPDNVTTTSVSVQPKYSSSNDGVRSIEGYTFTNSLSIDISNISNDLLSQVLDTAVRAGGDSLTINSVDFSLSPALAGNLTVQAETMAVREARAQADRYAANLGTTLGPALTVTTAPPPQPITTQPMDLRSSSTSEITETTPVSIGKRQVELSVSIVYTICTPRS